MFLRRLTGYEDERVAVGLVDRVCGLHSQLDGQRVGADPDQTDQRDRERHQPLQVRVPCRLGCTEDRGQARQLQRALAATAVPGAAPLEYTGVTQDRIINWNHVHML